MSRSFAAPANAENKSQFLLSVLGLKLYVTEAFTACAFKNATWALATPHYIYMHARPPASPSRYSISSELPFSPLAFSNVSLKRFNFMESKILFFDVNFGIRISLCILTVALPNVVFWTSLCLHGVTHFALCLASFACPL